MRSVFFYPASLSTVDLDLVVEGLFAHPLDTIDALMGAVEEAKNWHREMRK